MSRSDTWIETAEVLLQDGIVDVLEYDTLGGTIYCHFCEADQSDDSLPWVHNSVRNEPMDPERHHDDCWVLRVERLLKR